MSLVGIEKDGACGHLRMFSGGRHIHHKNHNFCKRYAIQAVSSDVISKLIMGLDSPYVKTYKSIFYSSFYIVLLKRYVYIYVSARRWRPSLISQFWGIINHFWAWHTTNLSSAPLFTSKKRVCHKLTRFAFSILNIPIFRIFT